MIDQELKDQMFSHGKEIIDEAVFNNNLTDDIIVEIADELAEEYDSWDPDTGEASALAYKMATKAFAASSLLV